MSTDIKTKTKERLATRDLVDSVKLYLRDVSKNPLLDHAQEIELSKTIQSSKQAILDILFAVPLTVTTVSAWISDIASGARAVADVFDLDTDADSEIDSEFTLRLIAVQTPKLCP